MEFYPKEINENQFQKHSLKVHKKGKRYELIKEKLNKKLLNEQDNQQKQILQQKYFQGRRKTQEDLPKKIYGNSNRSTNQNDERILNKMQQRQYRKVMI